jgi:hypothetical protein
MLLCSASWAWTQEAPAPAYGPDGATADSEIVLPASISGDAVSALFPAEGERSNYLSGGLSFVTAYDDNPLATTGNAVSDVSFAVMPFIHLNETRSRLRWQADYSPGFTFYRRLDQRNQDDHNLSLDLEYRLGPRLTMRLRDAFSKTSNFLGEPGQTQSTPFGSVQQSNLTVITPVMNRISNLGSGELSYQFGPSRVVGARGFSSELHFPDATSGLADSHSQAAEAFLAHRISGIHWLGATYRFQRILTDTNEMESFTHALLFSYTINITPSMTLSLFAGPQHAETSGLGLIANPQWLPAVGGSFTWQSNRMSFGGSVAHRISDGGGLAGAVQLTSFDASYRYRWTRHWELRLESSYGKSELLDTFGLPSQDSRSVIGLIGISREIGEHLTVGGTYLRANQTGLGTSGSTIAFDRNRPQISISYHFSRPIGR